MPEKLFYGDFLRVYDSCSYKLITAFLSDEDTAGNLKDIIIVFELYDFMKSRIETRQNGLLQSDKYGYFLYGPVTKNGETKILNHIFEFTSDVYFIRLAVYKWQCRGTINYFIGPRLVVSSHTKMLVEYERIYNRNVYIVSEKIPVFENTVYRLMTYITPLGIVDKTDKALVVLMRFFDTSGNLILQPIPGIGHSDGYGHYMYISLSPNDCGMQISNDITMPAGISWVRLTILSWNYSDIVHVSHPAQLVIPLIAQQLEVAEGQNYIIKYKNIYKASPPCFIIASFYGVAGNKMQPQLPFQCSPYFPPYIVLYMGMKNSKQCTEFLRFSIDVGIVSFDYTLYSLTEKIDFQDIEFSVSSENVIFSGQLQRNLFSINSYFTYRLIINCSGGCSRGGVLSGKFLINFLDTENKSIGFTEKNLASRNLSIKVDPFFYVAEGSSCEDMIENRSYEIEIIPPNAARKFCLTFANEYEHEIGISFYLKVTDFSEEQARDDFDFSKEVLLNTEFELTEVRDEFVNYLIKWIIQNDKIDLFGELLGYCSKHGLLSIGSKIANAVLSLSFHATKLHVRAKHLLSEYIELTPGWTPTINVKGSPPPPRKDRSIRVAHLFKTVMPYEFTGGSVRCANIVASQKKAGLEPIVVTPLGYPNASSDGSIFTFVNLDGVAHYHLSSMSMEDANRIPVTDRLTIDTLLTYDLLKDKDIDIIQASSGYRGYELALKGIAIAQKLAIPFIYEVRSLHEHTWTKDEQAFTKEKTHLRMAQEAACMQAADAVITICETMRQQLVKRNIPEGKIYIVPNAVDTNVFYPRQPRAELLRSLGVDGQKVIGYISNISKREGHEVLVRAISHVRTTHPDIVCLFIGEGPELAKLKHLVKTLNLEKLILFLGSVPHDEIADYYSIIDIFVIPRIADYASDFVTPMKPLEAMAMQRPIIASDRPALIELLGNGKLGQLFSSGDVVQLASAIIQYLDNPEMGIEKAAHAYSWVTRERVWDKNSKTYKELYVELLNMRKSS